MRLDPDARLPISNDVQVLKTRLSDVFRNHAIAINKLFTFQYGDVAAGNYMQINDDGTITLYGTATAFNDLQGQLIGQKLESPSSKIVANNAEVSVTFKTTATPSDYVTMNSQLSHAWKLDSTLHPHLHWCQTSASTPNWMIQYRWQINGSAKTTAWTSAKYGDNAFTYSSGTLNQITEFGDITPPVGAKLSDIIQFRIIRDTANASGLFTGADPVAADVDAVSFDSHIELDSFGSSLEYTK